MVIVGNIRNKMVVEIHHPLDAHRAAEMKTNNSLNDFKIHTIFEQEATHDGKFSMPIPDLLMTLANYYGAWEQEDVDCMVDPKRYVVRVIVEVKEK